MITPNPIIGTVLHAIGGISAASCYLPNTQTKKWSWGTFWLAQALFAWVIMPLVVGWFTVPGFFKILVDAPAKPFWMAFLLGAAYGFGGMSFGKAINHIGYSLTYTLLPEYFPGFSTCRSNKGSPLPIWPRKTGQDISREMPK